MSSLCLLFIPFSFGHTKSFQDVVFCNAFGKMVDSFSCVFFVVLC